MGTVQKGQVRLNRMLALAPCEGEKLHRGGSWGKNQKLIFGYINFEIKRPNRDVSYTIGYSFQVEFKREVQEGNLKGWDQPQGLDGERGGPGIEKWLCPV